MEPKQKKGEDAMRFVVLSILFALLAWPALAGEISLLGGYGATNNPVQKASAWQLEYMEGLSEHFALSLSYLNQGHFIEHHRDGNAVNLWVRTNRLHRQLSLAAGAGGVFYYDTIHPARIPARTLALRGVYCRSTLRGKKQPDRPIRAHYPALAGKAFFT